MTQSQKLTPHDHAAIERGLRAFSREPFSVELARFLCASPDAKHLKEWAEKYPDKWANAVAALAKLAGYSEKIEIDRTGSIHHLESLSDAHLEQELQKAFDAIRGLVAQKSTRIIDITPEKSLG